MPTEDQLWAAYQADRTDENRNAIFEHHWQWVSDRVAAYLKAHRSARITDEVLSLVADGILARIIPEYQPARGTFTSYLRSSIRILIHDAIVEIRRDSAPRSNRRTNAKIARHREQLAHRLGHWPTDADVAESLGMPEIEIVRLSTGREVQLDRDPPDRSREARFDELVEALPEDDRRILRMYFLENRTWAEIAQLVGWTEDKVEYRVKWAKRILRLNTEST